MLKIKRILVSQPKPSPEKSPYADLIKKHNVKIDFFKFFKIIGIPCKEFRQQRINIADYTAIILTSKNAVDNFFKMSEELRQPISDDVKYFCSSEAIAFYLQKYVLYRKRKVFSGKTNFMDLMEIIKKHKEEKFLLPCTENHKIDIPSLLDSENINYNKAIISRTISENLNKIDLIRYDMYVFFSPSGIKSLFENEPTFKQGDKVIAVFGKTTLEEAKKNVLKPQIIAPTKETPSMTMAIDAYLEKLEKSKRKAKRAKAVAASTTKKATADKAVKVAAAKATKTKKRTTASKASKETTEKKPKAAPKKAVTKKATPKKTASKTKATSKNKSARTASKK